MEEVINTSPVYCLNCHSLVPYYLLYEEEEWISSEGIPLKYYSMMAVCDKCHHEVYVPQVNDWNVEHRERLYKKFGDHYGIN